MKAEIHPEIRTVVFQDSITGTCFKVQSSVKTKDSITVDGEELPLVKLDVTSASHPFYTGEQRIVDTAGRVEKFGNKFGASLSNPVKKKK